MTQNGAHGSSCGPPCSAAAQSNYGKFVASLAAVTDRKDCFDLCLAAVEDHKNHLVLGLFAAVVDHKDIQSLTHFEDSVEDRRTTDLAWLTQQDQE